MKWIFPILLLFPSLLIAQFLNVKGVVHNALDGDLPLAHIVILPDSTTAISDYRGRFAIAVLPGDKQFIISYTGYKTADRYITITRDTTLHFLLQASVDQLQEIVVTGQRDRQMEIFESTQSSINILMPEDITAIPVLGGEADLIKVLQLLPGTVKGIEGSSDLFVRGGAADQNLVLLDDATIYNTSHLFGFVSVFNPDLLASVESVNGGFPARYGGRLSSILNVKTNSSIAEQTHVSGDIGLIASRLYIEQPIIKDKLSLWASGRRTYIDQVVKVIGEKLPYYFYDFNARVIAHPSAQDQISFSVYRGDDELNIFRDRNNDGDGFLTAYHSGNNSQSLQWRRQLSKQWYGKLSLMRTAFAYDINNAFRNNSILALSDIEDLGAKVEVGTLLPQFGNLKLGMDWVNHQVSPSIVSSTGTIAEVFSSSSSTARVADELALYAEYEWKSGDQLTINTGIRGSMAKVKNKSYFIPEPRLSVRYALNEREAIKFSYARMAQYIHRISNSAVTTPTDIWYPSTDSIRPQTSHQFAVAWQRTFSDQPLFLSAEAYYKPMNDLIGLEPGTNLFFNTDFSRNLLQGRGKAYGLELLARKDHGKFTGWISYTLSWAQRQFNQINSGQWFRSRYDRRHNGAIVGQYALHPRWSVSLVWEYISGSRFTPIIGQYQVVAPTTTGVNLVPVFAPINSVKLADAHRLDAGIKFKSKPAQKFKYEWFVGVYNAYNRTNPVAISINTDEVTGAMRYEQPGLFGLLPFISYGFKF